MPGAFDGAGQLSLVFGARSCLTAGTDFSMIGGKPGQGIRVFMINF